MPRRMRRKMRGGGQGESRLEDRAERASGGIQPQPAARDRRSRARTPRGEPAAAPSEAPLPSITELLKEGQEIIVQIAKEPLGQKGARITSHIALPGRYVVYMPTSSTPASRARSPATKSACG